MCLPSFVSPINVYRSSMALHFSRFKYFALLHHRHVTRPYTEMPEIYNLKYFYHSHSYIVYVRIVFCWINAILSQLIVSVASLEYLPYFVTEINKYFNFLQQFIAVFVGSIHLYTIKSFSIRRNSFPH